jgi:hypothetical protein
MSFNNYLLVDKNSTEWEYIYRIARNDKSHELWQNYQDIDLDTYEHMIVYMRDNIPSGFHGIYNNGRWPNNVSRICNRAYLQKYNRDLGQGLDITGDNIIYVLDNYDKWNKDILFISRGVQYDNPKVSYKKFKSFCKFLTDYTGYNLTYDDRLYSCCDSHCKECYQFCVWYDPKNIRDILDIKNISIDEWSNLKRSQ